MKYGCKLLTASAPHPSKSGKSAPPACRTSSRVFFPVLKLRLSHFADHPSDSQAPCICLQMSQIASPYFLLTLIALQIIPQTAPVVAVPL